jgi:EARLY FLOWERING 3 protein
MNASSNGRAANGTRAESLRQSSHLKSNDTNASGPTTKCRSKHTKNTNKNSSGNNLATDDDFTVPLLQSRKVHRKIC